MLRKFFTTVTVKDNYVYVSNIDVKELSKFLIMNRKVGKYKKFNVITTDSWREIKFPEFFLPEIYYLLSNTYESLILLNIPLTTASGAMLAAKVYKLFNLLKKLRENTWLKNINVEYPDILDFKKLDDLNYIPKDFQLDFLKYYNNTIPKYNLKGVLLDATPGSGKTFTTLALAHCLDAFRIIVICPLPAVIRVWDDQIKKVFKKQQNYWLSTDNKSYQGQRIAVYHYEALQKAVDDLEKLKVDNKRLVVILDESHNLNNPKSLRTERFENFVNNVRATDIIFASGTAVKAMAAELVTLFRVIDPLFTKDAEIKFKSVYSPSMTDNLELLKTRLGQVSFKVEKSSINLNAPNLIHLPIQIPDSEKYTLANVAKEMKKFIEERAIYYDGLFPDNYKFYNYCLDYYKEIISNDNTRLLELQEYKNLVNQIRRTDFADSNIYSLVNKIENKSIIPLLHQEDKARFKEVKTLIKYPRLKIQGEALGRILGQLRVDCHREMAKHINYNDIVEYSEKKVVIFSSYIDVCETTVNKLIEKDYKPAKVYGSFTKNLAKSVNEFMNIAEINPLVATYASLSTAVPLIVANTVVLINAPFRTYIQEQAISRVHRIGQDTAVFVYECFLDTGDESNLSTRNIDILKWSQEQVSLILGTKSIFDSSDIADDIDGLKISNESYGIEILEHYNTDIKIVNNTSLLEKW